MEKLSFQEALGQHLDLGMGPNCSYRDWQIFGLIVFGYLCGYDRLAHFEELSRDLTVQHLLGLAGPIDENTLGLYSLFSKASIISLFPLLLANFITKVSKMYQKGNK